MILDRESIQLLVRWRRPKSKASRTLAELLEPFAAWIIDSRWPESIPAGTPRRAYDVGHPFVVEAVPTQFGEEAK